MTDKRFAFLGIGTIFLFLLALTLPFWLSLASAACTNTTNLSLCKPAISDSGWGASLNTNFDLIDAKFPGGSAVPSNVIVFTSDATCPTGFTEYTTARGRFIVGMPASGTNEGTVGTALTNLQDKTHTHTYTDVVNHVHSVDPPSTAATVTDPQHTHSLTFRTSAAGDAEISTINYLSSRDSANNNHAISGGATANTAMIASTTTGITASVDIAAFNSANPTGGVATGTTNTTALSISWPYIQLRLCKKS